MVRSKAWVVGFGAALVFHLPLVGQEADPVPRGSSVVTGRVTHGETGEPVPSAIVELLFASDSLQVGASVSDANGRFLLEEMPEGTFFVRLVSLGFGTVTTELFEVAEAERRNLGDLAMSVEAVEIAPITVSAERTVVTYEADRTSYNVGVMPGTEGASVTEALSSIAELEVDIDGQVTLRNGQVAIYIDGREAPMSGEALAVFLEQFPAEYLQKIEILDNPSARYDAEGAGGIVNLVTKEGVELGLSGSVFANAGTRGQYGVGGRGTFQRGEWTLNGGGFFRLSDSESSDFALRQNLFVDPSFLRQDSWSDGSGLSTNLDLEAAYEPEGGPRIFVEGRMSRSGRDSQGLTTTTHLDDLQAPILAYDRLRASDNRALSFDFATGLEYEWEPNEQQLEVELQLERGTDRERSRDEITEGGDVSGHVLIPAELTLEDQDEVETELSLQADYVRGWGEGGEIELGYELERNLNDSDRLINLIDDPVASGDLTNRGHDERETAHSVYTTLERQFGSLGVEGGLRAEHVDRRFELPEGETFGRSGMDFFPSANVSYRVGEDWNLRLAYSRRVERPRMSVLNPVDLSTDPAYREVGNPDIEPQYSHTVSMNVSWSLSSAGSIRLSPYYRTSRNGWAEITTVDDVGVSTRTYENVTSRQDYGASLTYSIRQRGGWRGNMSVSAAREVRDASNLDERYSGSSLRFSSRANVNGNLTEDLSAQANLSYYPAADLPQGRRDARYRADFGLRYRLLDQRASIRLRLRDPFELRRSSSRLQDLDYILIDRTEESFRSAQISISYALGGGGESGGGRRGRR